MDLSLNLMAEQAEEDLDDGDVLRVGCVDTSFTLNSLTRALQEVVASFSVYRAYVRPGVRLDRDVKYVERAVARAKRRNPAMSSVIFDFVRDVLLLREKVLLDDQERESLGEFTGKFQQVTGPIMAKAIEDTAFYRFNRLVSLNEVGGEPATFGVSLADFHRYAFGIRKE